MDLLIKQSSVEIFFNPLLYLTLNSLHSMQKRC